jgi:hypothetical protein
LTIARSSTVDCHLISLSHPISTYARPDVLFGNRFEAAAGCRKTALCQNRISVFGKWLRFFIS